jgi:hypothetical protein
VTLAVTEIVISSRIIWHCRMTVYQWHRVPLIPEVDGIIRLVSYSEKTPTFCVFSVFGVTAMDKYCDACGYGDHISYGRAFRTLQGDGVSVAATGVNEKSTKRTVG